MEKNTEKRKITILWLCCLVLAAGAAVGWLFFYTGTQELERLSAALAQTDELLTERTARYEGRIDTLEETVARQEKELKTAEKELNKGPEQAEGAAADYLPAYLLYDLHIFALVDNTCSEEIYADSTQSMGIEFRVMDTKKQSPELSEVSLYLYDPDFQLLKIDDSGRGCSCKLAADESGAYYIVFGSVGSPFLKKGNYVLEIRLKGTALHTQIIRVR